MNEPHLYAPSPLHIRSQQEIDADHLSTLAICHYIAGAILFVSSSMFLIHICIGEVLIHNPQTFGIAPHSTYGQASFPSQLPFNPGYIFLAVGTVALTIGWLTALLSLISGWQIQRRIGYIFILVTAGLNCAFLNPLTTTLGIFTFIVLFRPTVKPLFYGGRT